MAEAAAPARFTAGGLTGGACAACERRHFPAAPWCPWCGAGGVDVVTLSTSGTLWCWTAVLVAPPGYTGDVPYGIGIVELPADGLRVVTRLTESDPARLTPGEHVEFSVVATGDGTTAWAYGPR